MKYVLSAIGGAVVMFLALVCIANFTDREKTANYEHIDYVSAIQQEDCYLCGDGADPLTAAYWGQDNVGILNLNTFEVLRLEINRYDDHGELITTQAGVMQSAGIQNVHAYVHPDRGYANVQISSVEYDTERDSVQNRLCQNCLDTLNGEWYGDEPPTEFAVVNFADKTVEAMMPSKTGFGSGNYYVDCEYNDDGKIDLLIFHCPPRYQKCVPTWDTFFPNSENSVCIFLLPMIHLQ